MKHLLLDVNIILDLWLERGEHWLIEELLERASTFEVQLWFSASSIPIIEYIFVRVLKKDGATKKEATEIARKLFAILTDYIQPLSNFGFEQQLGLEQAHDIEDAQVALCLASLHGDKKIVTHDADFDTLGLAEICTVREAVNWIKSEGSEPGLPIPFIDLPAQQDSIRPQLEKNIHTVLRHGRYILGPEVQELERRLAEFVDVKHCIGVSSGTDALLMCLMAVGIGPGDAVFTTPFTFIATAEVISLLGATPVFVDIDPQTYNISPALLKQAIEAVRNNDPSQYPLPVLSAQAPLKAKAVIPVDLFGLPADYDAIMQIAGEHDLFVIEDAAQGLGGIYNGRVAGGLGHMGTTSFFPAKPLGCYGDGGAIFTDDDDLAETARSIRVHGKGTDKYDNIRIGLNARLHTMQAAILLAKLEKFPEELAAKQTVAETYNKLLNPHLSALTPPLVPEGLKSAWAQYSVLSANHEQQSIIQNSLQDAGIPSMVYYAKPLHMQTAFSGLDYEEIDFPVAVETSRKIFSLPMHGYLTDEEINHIITTITAY